MCVCVIVTRYENGEKNLEQRCSIKFCVKFNENRTETYEKLKQAYREHAVSRAQVFRWHKAFLDGREGVEEEPRSGRLCTLKKDENVTKMGAFVRYDRRLTVRMISSELNLNHQTVHDIFTEEMGMRNICVKLVQKKPHQRTKRKPKECVPGPSCMHRK